MTNLCDFYLQEVLRIGSFIRGRKSKGGGQELGAGLGSSCIRSFSLGRLESSGDGPW